MPVPERTKELIRKAIEAERTMGLGTFGPAPEYPGLPEDEDGCPVLPDPGK